MKKKAVCSICLATILSLSTTVGFAAKPQAKAKRAPKVTITVMTSGTKSTNGKDFDTDVFPEQVHKAYPNVTVQVTKLPDDQYYTSLKTKLATGTAPNIFLVQPKSAGANAVVSMAKAGYLANLSDLKFWKNMPKSGKADMSYNGKAYAVPNGVSILGTYYNASMFKKAGISSVPKNWNAFLSDCAKLKSKGITPIVMGDKDSYVMQFGLYQIAANVVYPKDKNFDNELAKGTKKFTDSKWITTLSMYKTLYDKGYIKSGSLGIGSTQAIQTFIDGNAAMILDGTWDAQALEAKGAASFTRGFFSLPANKSGSTYTCASTAAGYAVYSKSKNVATCKKILNLLGDGKSKLFKAWSTDPRYISAYKGVKLNNKLFTSSMKAYQDGKAFYFCNQAWPSGTETEMENDFAMIIGGQGETVNKVAASMQKKYDELKK